MTYLRQELVEQVDFEAHGDRETLGVLGGLELDREHLNAE